MRIFLKIEQEEYQTCELTYVYIPKQNGVAKFRNNVTFFYLTRTMIYATNVYPKFSREIIHTTMYMFKKTSSYMFGLITTYQMWYKVKPLVAYIHI
jgi:hypothetical protein